MTAPRFRATSGLLFAAIIVLPLLAACGADNNAASTADQSLPPPDLGAPRGELHIQEHNGKRVLDAWFTDVVAWDAADAAQSIWQHETESCYLQHEQVQLTAGGVALLPSDSSANAAGSYWQDSYGVGDALQLASRDGVYATLPAQPVGDAVQYATEERWIAAPLPDDTLLTIPGSERYPSIDQLALTPLASLEVQAPQLPILQRSARELIWTASTVSTDQIQLRAMVRTDRVGEQLSSVVCNLADDGQFEMPLSVYDTLAGSDQAVVDITVFRQRISEHQQGDASLRIVQTSYP